MTPSGIKNVYDYGKRIRKVYEGFLDKPYHPSTVYARSTDKDRNLGSAYAFLAGLFRPNRLQTWDQRSELKNWYPIPVITIWILILYKFIKIVIL